MTLQNSPAQRSAAMNRFREGKVTGKGIIGLAVVSLDDGKEVGHIHDVVYNPREGRLVGFTIPHNAGLFRQGDTLWVDADDIHALGEDAVVVRTANTFRQYAESADEVAASAGEAVLGKRLMTDDGSFLGAIDDVLIDRQSRKVVAYEVSGGLWQDMLKGQTDVPVEQIISIGEDVVVVPASVKSHVEQASGGLMAVSAAAQEKAVEIKDTAAEKIDQVRTEAAVAIEARESEYALGKVAGRTVYLDDKNTLVLARENEVITQAHIAQAIPAGRMHSLALAAGWQQAENTAEAAKEKMSAVAATARDKAGEITDAAKDRYGATLVGKTTGRAVMSNLGTLLIPENHIVTATDVEAAKATGKLDDLTAAVGVAAMDAVKTGVSQAYDTTKARVGETLDATKEKVGEAYDAARERSAAEHAVAEARLAAASANNTVAPTIIIENPEQVIVQAPGQEVSEVPSSSGTTPSVPVVSQEGDVRRRLDE